MARSSVASITSNIATATATTATIIAIATATTTKINEATLIVPRRITVKAQTEISSFPTTAALVWAMEVEVEEAVEEEEGEEVTEAQAEIVSARNHRVLVATPTIIDTIARRRRVSRCG